jgi:hypothetical protein
MFYPGPLGEGETLADKIPSGYVICDGTNGTPNLLGKFIRAASDYNDVGDHTNSDLVQGTVGGRYDSIQIQEYNLPAHTHTFNVNTSNLSIERVEGSTSITIPSITVTQASILGGGETTYSVDNVLTSSYTETVGWGHTHNISGDISVT